MNLRLEKKIRIWSLFLRAEKMQRTSTNEMLNVQITNRYLGTKKKVCKKHFLSIAK